MRFVLLASLAASLALLTPVVSGASASSTSGAHASTAAVATIKLGGRTGIDGPWRNALRLKLKRGGIPVSFSVCAVWGEPPALTPECLQSSDDRLPEGTQLRLEQHRGGNRFGTVFYRVTLREKGTGHILRTSNQFKVVWHK
jgi:hypothetical protein